MTDSHDETTVGRAQRRLAAASGLALRRAERARQDDLAAGRRPAAGWDLSADAACWHGQLPETD